MIRRAGFIRRVSKKKARADRDLIAVKAKVVERSQGRCECGGFSSRCDGKATQFHHRLPRSAGGKHTEENLMHLCWWSHQEIHAYPEESYGLGLLLRRGEDPAEIPVRQSELS